MSIAELSLELRRAEDKTIVADIRIRMADGNDETTIGDNMPVALDEDALLQVADEPEIL